LASLQSRCTVCGETFSAAAVSSISRSPKNRQREVPEVLGDFLRAETELVPAGDPLN
jgi:hypothetical protein